MIAALTYNVYIYIIHFIYSEIYIYLEIFFHIFFLFCNLYAESFRDIKILKKFLILIFYKFFYLHDSNNLMKLNYYLDFTITI